MSRWRCAVKAAQLLPLQIPEESRKPSDAALQFLACLSRANTWQDVALPKAGLSPPSCSTRVCVAGLVGRPGLAIAKNATVTQRLAAVCLISTRGSNLNFSFLPSLWFPWNFYQPHDTHAVMHLLTRSPSGTCGWSQPATSQVHVQEEKQRKRWSRRAPSLEAPGLGLGREGLAALGCE